MVGPEGISSPPPARPGASETDTLIGQIRALRQEEPSGDETEAEPRSEDTADAATSRNIGTGSTIARITGGKRADPAPPPREGEVSSAAQVAGETDMEG